MKKRFKSATGRKDLMNPPGPGAIPPQGPELPPEAAYSTSPEATAAMAAGGLDVVRGNSNKQPLSPEGEQTVQRVAGAMGPKGLDRIQPSASVRAQQTAGALSQASGALSSQPLPDLESHALGALEGAPKTPEVKKFLATLVRKYPDFRIPGQGALSGRPGESFNDYRVRALGAVSGLMQTLAESPLESIAVPTHSQIINLVRAWVAAGLPEDLSIDSTVMTAPDTAKPGEVERFFPTTEDSPPWRLEPFNPEEFSALPKGSIYFVRHGETPATQASSARVSPLQRSRAEIVSHVKRGDFGRARAVAKSASAQGLSDDEISQAIDEALPSGKDAQNLPSHHLLSAASAASSAKRAELLPALQARFSSDALGALHPQAAQALNDHLQRLS